MSQARCLLLHPAMCAFSRMRAPQPTVIWHGTAKDLKWATNIPRLVSVRTSTELVCISTTVFALSDLHGLPHRVQHYVGDIHYSWFLCVGETRKPSGNEGNCTPSDLLFPCAACRLLGGQHRRRTPAQTPHGSDAARHPVPSLHPSGKQPFYGMCPQKDSNLRPPRPLNRVFYR